MFMRCIILSSVVCLAFSYFSTLSHKTVRFSGEKVFEYELCVLVFYTAFVWKISDYEKVHEDIIIIVYRS